MNWNILELNSSFKLDDFHTENISSPYAGGMKAKKNQRKMPGWAPRLRARLKEKQISVPKLAEALGYPDDTTFTELWYIDAFAGTGTRTVRVEARDGDLFDAPVAESVEHRRGSAQIAIDVVPHFNRLVFIDSKPKHCAALRELAARGCFTWNKIGTYQTPGPATSA